MHPMYHYAHHILRSHLEPDSLPSSLEPPDTPLTTLSLSTTYHFRDGLHASGFLISIIQVMSHEQKKLLDADFSSTGIC